VFFVAGGEEQGHRGVFFFSRANLLKQIFPCRQLLPVAHLKCGPLRRFVVEPLAQGIARRDLAQPKGDLRFFF
jgi:hypothetical protein